MIKHNEFILTSIVTVLEEGVSACLGIGDGIETYPLNDYIMQSIFLKMTGFQEQKLKCIAWEMGSNDNEYRRRLLNNDDRLGEYSNYNAKNSIFKNLYVQLKRMEDSTTIESIINRDNIISQTCETVKGVFFNTNLAVWAQKDFDYFCEHIVIKEIDLIKNVRSGAKQEYPNLFENELKNKYDDLYLHRNRLAHNTLSYQQNLPTLRKLSEEKDESRNYFIWFAILLLIDNVFIAMYREFEKLLVDTIY